MRKLSFLSAALVVTVTACGGGGGGGSAPPAPTPVPVPPLQFTSTGETFPNPPAAPLTVGNDTIRVIVASVTNGLPTSGTQATFDYSTSASFTSDPAFAGVPAYVNVGSPAVLYFGLKIAQSQSITFSAQPGFTVSLPSASGHTYHIAAYDPTNPAAGYVDVGGPVTASASLFTVPGATTSTTYQGNTLYVYVLHG